MKLKCVRECVMQSDGQVTTTAGKVYEVIERCVLWGFMIIDDSGDEHWFDVDEDGKYHYLKWFEEVV